MTIRHPYNFVPLAERLVREAPGSHERFEAGRHSGTLVCQLETLAPLSIKTHFEALKAARPASEEPWIPGSSLKGMVRNVLEMLGLGCGRYFEARGSRVSPDLGQVRPCPEGYACRVCRLFGYTGEKGRAGQGEEKAYGWAGKLRFRDAHLGSPMPSGAWKEPGAGTGQLMSHGPRHIAFYYPERLTDPNSSKPAGWKVYLHSKTPVWPGGRTVCRAWAREGCKFRVAVEYENLTDEEVAVLRFGLTLSHQCAEHNVDVKLCHKLGYGKPLGMGSCRVTLEEVRPESLERYFGESRAAPGNEVWCKVEEHLKGPSFEAMKEFLSWEGRPEKLEYPGLRWLESHADSGIDAFEREKNAAEGGRGGLNLVVPAPEPAPSPEVRIPRRVTAIVTKVARDGKVKAVTVEEYGGRKYTVHVCGGGWCRVGDERQFKVVKEDHVNATLEGRMA